MYDLELKVRTSTLDAPRIGRPEEIRRYIDSLLAAWGIPIPPLVRNPAEFAAALAETGEYAYDAPDVHVLVKRSA